ncbi:hypothetical protein Ddye_009011 [Dipteronia dyeriana]|uniref:Uncharacterized protein n=1 Tax=Dipteronia dyeriana TaxID=168575 RepID=A0AAE0CLZ4_9ROSI|nr:hypothetical protein Ddye_009011 [Dipteronia dyeriana]
MENSNSSIDQSCIYDMLYSPCSLFEKLFKAIYKCLGGGARDNHQDPKTQHVDTNSPSHESERQMKSTEDELAVLIRRPQRPPASSGEGGQIN